MTDTRSWWPYRGSLVTDENLRSPYASSTGREDATSHERGDLVVLGVAGTQGQRWLCPCQLSRTAVVRPHLDDAARWSAEAGGAGVRPSLQPPSLHQPGAHRVRHALGEHPALHPARTSAAATLRRSGRGHALHQRARVHTGEHCHRALATRSTESSVPHLQERAGAATQEKGARR